MQKKLESAEVLWRQVLVLSGGKDEDALNALLDIRHQKHSNEKEYVPNYQGIKTSVSQKNPNQKFNTKRILAVTLSLIGQLCLLFFIGTGSEFVFSNIFWLLF